MKDKRHASGASANAALRGGSLAAFALALAFAFAGGLWSPADSPPYFDFDASTEAIFVNNLSFQDRYDHYFAAPLYCF